MPVVSTAAMSTVAVVTNGHLVVQEGGKGNKAADSSSTAGSVNSFATAAEEAAYWRTKFEALARESQVTKEEFEEFQEGSRELEAELEAQLEQSEVKIKEYRSLSNRLHMDNDELKAKLEQSHKEYAFQVGEKRYTYTLYIICYLLVFTWPRVLHTNMYNILKWPNSNVRNLF